MTLTNPMGGLILPDMNNTRVGLGHVAWVVLFVVACASETGVDDESTASSSPSSKPSASRITKTDLAQNIDKKLQFLNDRASAVQGFAEVYAGGKLVGSSVIGKGHLPSNIAELVATGATDAAGNQYGDVAGTHSDGEFEVRYSYIERTFKEAASDRVMKPSGRSYRAMPVAHAGAIVAPAVQAIIDAEPSGGSVGVLLTLAKKFKSRLRGSTSRALSSLRDAAAEQVEWRSSLDARKAEAEASQAPVVNALSALGAGEISGAWGTNAVTAQVPMAALKNLAQIPGVLRIDLDQIGEELSSTQWDGADMKAPGGMNAAIYHDSGYTGQAYAGVSGGRNIRIGFITSNGAFDHPGFRDGPGQGSRAIYYNCSTSPCTLTDLPTDSVSSAHDLKCAGLAAGSVRQGQLGDSNTDAWRTERSGVAEEPTIYFFGHQSWGATIRAIQFAIDNGIDFLQSSYKLGGDTAACNGITPNGVQDLVYEAQLQNILVVQAAGNDGHSGSCNLSGLADAPSTFVVGGLGSGSNTCTSSNYSSCAIYGSSSLGGMDATIDGTTYSGVVSQVAVTAPACPQYYYGDTSPWIVTYGGNTTCGTSYAAPQVAGAAVLLKDYFLTQGFTSIGIEGRPFVLLLAMSDRNGTVSSSLSGFDPLWGGGRFQMRRFDSADHSGVWGWESWSTIVSDGQVSTHSLGTMPSTVGQFKTYGMFFENDTSDMADIDIQVRSTSCTGSILNSDNSRDTKTMVRLGNSAASTTLCNRIEGYHVPSGETRRFHQFAYWSADTSMR